jgi:transposase InsO family protein
MMKGQISKSQSRQYPMRMILKIAGLSSAAWYRRKPDRSEKRRPGPKPLVPDQVLLVEAKREINDSIFTGEGYQKIHKRMRVRGIISAKERVNRVMRDNLLLSPNRPKLNITKNDHKGKIITEMPNRMWGTDGKRFFTLNEGWCWLFSVIDHCNDEIITWHTAKVGNRFAAMEPVRMAVKKIFGSLERGICKDTGLFLRSDHGSQYDSDDFQRELKFLNLSYSPAFVRSPQCNGIIERFHRTINEQVFDLWLFDSLEQAQRVIAEFMYNYNHVWILHRLGLKTPVEYRKFLEMKKENAA